jgi:hypothetical protein
MVISKTPYACCVASLGVLSRRFPCPPERFRFWNLLRHQIARSKLLVTGMRSKRATQRNPAEVMFALSRPCGNCPFLKEGAIDLAPGRLESIVEEIVNDDLSTFHCHKTVYRPSTARRPKAERSMCAGAMIYLEKVNRPTVGMRLGHLCGAYDAEAMQANAHLVIEPLTRPAAAPRRRKRREMCRLVPEAPES